MTHPRSITTNLKFTYADQRRKLGGLLKYFQHRDDKDGRGHIPQIDEAGRRVPRWVDRGLGSSHGRILQQIGELATDTLKHDVEVTPATPSNPCAIKLSLVCVRM